MGKVLLEALVYGAYTGLSSFHNILFWSLLLFPVVLNTLFQELEIVGTVFMSYMQLHCKI